MATTVFQPQGVNLAVRAVTLADGPNTGWSYLTGTDSPVQFTEQVIMLNGVLNPANMDQVNRDFWAAQPVCDRAAMLMHVRKHERRHVDLYVQNRHIIDTEAEQLMAFMSHPDWLMSLGVNGAHALQIVQRLRVITGGQHLLADGFDHASPCPNLLNPTPAP